MSDIDILIYEKHRISKTYRKIELLLHFYYISMTYNFISKVSTSAFDILSV